MQGCTFRVFFLLRWYVVTLEGAAHCDNLGSMLATAMRVVMLCMHFTCSCRLQ